MSHTPEQAIHRAPRMLIADDDPAIVKFVARRCVKMGFEVDTATNGLQALMKANRRSPDILIIDVNMPGADGLSVCERLLDPSRRPLNVVVVTGGRDLETIERCESYGAFYTRKDADFWDNLSSALAETFPMLAAMINETGLQPEGEVRPRPRVLVVDDDADIESFLFSRLRKRGVDMLFASNAEQGHKLACKQGPSVIVSDYEMPNGDANYLLTRLRNTPETQETPVIILSGRRLDQITHNNLMREVSGKPGASMVLKKSFDTKELFEALEKFCSFER